MTHETNTKGAEQKNDMMEVNTSSANHQRPAPPKQMIDIMSRTPLIRLAKTQIKQKIKVYRAFPFILKSTLNYKVIEEKNSYFMLLIIFSSPARWSLNAFSPAFVIE